MAKLFATTRMFTGRPTSRAYVYDRETGKVVVACPHRHRKHKTALRCSERLLRQEQSRAGEDQG
jgi:hypothetical protein